MQGHQFWTRTDGEGSFTINHVRAGIYNLYAWVPGFIGDFKHEDEVVILSEIMDSLSTYQHHKMNPHDVLQVVRFKLVITFVYEPPTLWEIGVPDRTAFEFYVPDPAPWLQNKLYINHTEK